MTIIINFLKQSHIVTAVFLISTFALLQTAAAQAVGPLVSAPRAPNDNASPSIAILLVILIFALFITGFCSIYIRHCSEAYVAPGAAAIGPRGIDPDVLSTFPIIIYSTVKKGQNQNPALQCAVCLSEFEELDTLRLLPKCSHVFHPDCIDAWLSSHVTCPVCRAKLKPEEAEVKMETAEESNSAYQVFDESSERWGEVFGGGIDGGVGGGVDGVVGKGNGSSKVEALRVLVRSHSTGHSLVELGKCFESFTLKFPEEMRKRIVDGRMKRSASYDVVLQCGGEGSSSSSSKGKNSRWVLSMTPPFVSSSSSGVGSNECSTCSGIQGFWASSFSREVKECEGRMGLQVV